jgi:rod shape-determining protein MreC
LVTFRNADTRPILGRGPSVLLRFVFYALLCFGLMWLDERQGYLERVRYGLSMVAYPVQVLVNSPGAAWSWLEESFATRERLERENEQLRTRLRATDLKLMRFASLEQENIRLRGMREATANITERSIVAEILRVDVNPHRHRVVINKGARDGVFKGQPILDARGVFGQITRAGAFTSEAILISDTEHAIPVQVNRNGIRSIAVGTGDLRKLSLPFLPINADVQVGDLLVTSGLGGVFPSGYPVATVKYVNKDVAQTLADIAAEPAATLDRDREVLLVWVRAPPPEPEVAQPEASETPETSPPKPEAQTP